MPGPADEIKARLNAVELIGETVKLRRSGRTFTGLCPFHAHTKNTPSFVVWPDTGTWRCFGQCNEGGDLFKFVMKKENWGFREALEYLAGRAGVELKPRTPQDEQREEEHKRLRDLLNLSVTYYRNLLLNAPQGQAAREHLQKRGLTPSTLETFEIGYALASWDAAQKFFAERGFTRKEMVDAGMIVERDDGSTRDRFRNRIMIPIRDGQGRVAGFGARHLDPNDNPKFLNSPLTALFNKGDTVYALDRARKTISASGVAVLVEGYMDVMAAHQAGFTNVVSAMGTALTETQLRLIKKFAKRIVLALDADAAGDKATLRGLNVARETLDHDYTPAFDARGLIRSESKLQADIRVFTLPEGLDPDDLIASDPNAWKRGIDEAAPIVEYVMRALTAGRDLDDPKVKGEVADEILPIIHDVADPVERDSYRQKLARLLKVDERALTQKLHPEQSRKMVKPPTRAQPSARPPLSPALPTPEPASPEIESAPVGVESSITESSVDRLESYCLGALARHPDLVAKADRQLREWKLAPLSADDFSHTDLQIIFSALKAALDQHHLDPGEHMQLQLDDTFAARLQKLLEASHDVSVEDRRRVEDVLSAVMRLRKRNIDNALHELRFLQEDAHAQADEELSHVYQDQIYNLVKALQKVTNALKEYMHRAERFGIAGLN
ncbi:MAG: DNA primase [Chloroflexi bacterium]|nr:DNA primase [Chloroflexota bacterium]